MFKSRREIIRLIGIAPFLAPAFRDALAQQGNGPLKRLVIMMRYNGAPLESWYPASWSNFAGSSLASLNDAKLKSRLSVIKNMTNPFIVQKEDHHSYGARGIWAAKQIPEAGISLDQYIVNKTNPTTARKNICLGVYSQGFDNITDTFFKAPGAPADINDDPYDAIDRVFASFVPAMGTPDNPASVTLAKNKSILDAISSNIGQMSRNLVGEEKAKLDAHLTFVRSAEARLSNMMGTIGPAPSCRKLTQPTTRFGVRDLAKLPDIAKVHIALVTMAMACDISRIFVIQILSSYTNVGGGTSDLPWCGANIARDRNSAYRDGAGNPVLTLHQYHHATVGDKHERAIYRNINTAYASMFADLMTSLDAVSDGANATLLDNSISVLGSEYGGDYEAGNRHAPTNLPFLIGGGGGGFLKTNQMVDLQGAPHTQLLGTLLEYFGIEDGTGTKSMDFGNRNKGLSYASIRALKKP
jgi:hypothetical protein